MTDPPTNQDRDEDEQATHIHKCGAPVTMTEDGHWRYVAPDLAAAEARGRELGRRDMWNEILAKLRSTDEETDYWEDAGLAADWLETVAADFVESLVPDEARVDLPTTSAPTVKYVRAFSGEGFRAAIEALRDWAASTDDEWDRQMATHCAEYLATDGLESLLPHCCDLHGRNCEPPSELCCQGCTEASHPDHGDRTVCSAPDLSGFMLHRLESLVPDETRVDLPTKSAPTEET